MIIPINDKIVLKYIERDITTKSGLIVLDSRGTSTDTGLVVAVNEKTSITEGEKVLYNKHAAINIEYEGESYLLINEEDILAIM